MPVMTFLKRPKPYSRLQVGGEQLEAGRDHHRSDVDLELLSRACRSMQRRGQAATHSPHSQQTAQSRQRPAAGVGLRLGHRRLELVEVRSARRQRGASAAGGRSV